MFTSQFRECNMGKVKCTETKKPTLKLFPRLMRNDKNGWVILMAKWGKGTVVYGQDDMIGHYSENWAIDDFSDYDGQITIKNEYP